MEGRYCRCSKKGKARYDHPKQRLCGSFHHFNPSSYIILMLLTRDRFLLQSTSQDDALYRILVLNYLMAPGENRNLDLYQFGGK